MKSLPLAALLGLTAFLGACDVKLGHDDEASDGAAANVSAAGKAEEGRLSISAPGFEMNLAIPESIRAEAGIDSDNGLIYPNARFSGIHVEGGRNGDHGSSDGEVELRFSTSDSPDVVGRWYRDPARSADFAIASDVREGADFVIAGTTKEEGGQFRVRLSPLAGGGTDGRVVLADRD